MAGRDVEAVMQCSWIGALTPPGLSPNGGVPCAEVGGLTDGWRLLAASGYPGHAC